MTYLTKYNVPQFGVSVSAMIPVCHNLRRYANKVFKGIATDGKGTMGWCHGFKLHLACNDRGEIIAFVLTGANVSDKDPNVFKVLAKRLYGKLLADKGYIAQKLFDFLFEDGIQLLTGLRVNMKNKLMPFYDRMMLRKRYIIETINDMLKNTAQIVHSRHRSVSNFIMNLISALGAYCFFDNKPMALQGIHKVYPDNDNERRFVAWLLQIASIYRNVMPKVNISNYLFFHLNKILYFCGQ